LRPPSGCCAPATRCPASPHGPQPRSRSGSPPAIRRIASPCASTAIALAPGRRRVSRRNCTKAGATTAGDPKLLNTAKGSTTGLVNITWTSNHYDQKLFTNVFNELKNLRSDTVQVEFTGNAFQNIGQSNGGMPPFAFGFIAALIILLIVFRTVAATALPLATAVAALGAGLGLIGMLTTP